MMTYERSESTQVNFGKFIQQLQPNSKTLIRKFARILIKSYRQNVYYIIKQVMYSYGPPHMAVQKQDDQHEHTFSNYVRIQDVVQKTCLRL